MNTKLLETIKTTEERNDLVHRLDSLDGALFDDKHETEELINSHLPISLANLLGDETDRSRIRARLKEIRSEVLRFPIIKLIVAQLLPIKLAREVADEARQLFGAELVVDFERDPSLIGGAKVYLSGKYTDRSLATLIDQKVSKYI